VVLAVRLPCRAGELDLLPGLTIDGLSDADARALLAAQSHETLDEQVRDRLVAEARGNPLPCVQIAATPVDGPFGRTFTSTTRTAMP
jgi:hypothetical protein